MLRAFEEGGGAGGEGNVGAGGAGDGFLELGGMRRFAEETGFAFAEAVLERAVAAGAVRVQEVAVFLVALPDGGDDGAGSWTLQAQARAPLRWAGARRPR